MGIFSKIKHHIKNITKSTGQEAKKKRELAETVAKDEKEEVEKKAHKAKNKPKGLIKKGKKKRK